MPNSALFNNQPPKLLEYLRQAHYMLSIIKHVSFNIRIQNFTKLKHTVVLMLLFVACTSFQEKRGFPSPLSPRTASYDMQLTLDTEKRQVNAQQTLTFINPSDDTIWTMPFHMYYNAFKSNKTTFMTGTGRIPRTKPQDEIDDCIWGWVEVLEAKDEQGNDLTKNMAYIQPDDDNTADHTVLEIKLQNPILPRQTYQLDMKWQSQIPPLFARTGYSQDFYFMVQWYPKLGVYEPAGTRFAKKGQWNCHQYHANTEYYGEFGVYRVEMTVPKHYKLGASGFLLDEKIKGEQKTYTYLAEDVIDFAWTTSPKFVEIIEDWKGVELKLMIMPEHLHYKDRFLVPAKNALDFYEEYIEKYPYPTLTIVSPPVYGLGAGAMEYATLFTAPTLSGFPRGIRTTETLTIHELTHQYFYQMVSNNEQEEPWLDEGFTSFFEAKIMDKYFPKGVIAWDYMGMYVGSEEFRRGRFINAENLKVNPMSDFGWHFKHGSYAEIVYGKGAVMLSTLEGIVGEETMKAIIKTYFTQWKFKHPSRQAFIDVVNEVVSKRHNHKLTQEVNALLQQAIFETSICDYAVTSITNKVVTPPLGFFENTKDCKTPTKTATIYESKVLVFRLEEFIVPQDIRIIFDDGKELIQAWDGKSRSCELLFQGEHQVISAEVDPFRKIQLDKNFINNSHTLQQDHAGILRYFTSFMTWMESIMVSVSLLI